MTREWEGVVTPLDVISSPLDLKQHVRPIPEDKIHSTPLKCYEFRFQIFTASGKMQQSNSVRIKPHEVLSESLVVSVVAKEGTALILRHQIE